MKIKIIRTPQFDHIYDETWGMNNKCIPPLALGVLSGHLRSNGIDIEQDELDIKIHYDNLYYPEEYISGEILNNRRDEILRYLQGQENKELDDVSRKLARKTDLKFDVVLISCPPSCEITPTMATLLIAKYVKDNYKSIVVVGGPGVGQSKENWFLALKLKLIDFVISGPGETPLIKLIDTLKKSQDPSAIPGILYARNGSIFSNKPSERILDIIPDFKGLPLEKYLFNIPVLSSYLQKDENVLILPVQFIFGCPHQCAFCGQSTSKCTFLPAQKAVDMLERLSKEHNTRYFLFLNNTINIFKEYINRFCDEIIDRDLNIYWASDVNIKETDRDILVKMRCAGATRLIWGLETASLGMLKYINKGISKEQVEETLRISHELGIWNEIELICGFPHESEEDIDQTVNFLGRVENYIDGIYPHIFYLDPNSLMRRFPERYGITNIQEIDMAGSQKKGDPLGRFHFFYSFDEVDGLRWEEKKKQMLGSFEKITAKIRTLNFRNVSSNETPVVLFYLYTIFNDKQEIKKNFEVWSRIREGQKRRQTVFSSKEQGVLL